MSLIIADVSQYQGTPDWDAFFAANQAVILRAHYGSAEDAQWQRNAKAASAKAKWWAAYQYLPQTLDPTIAAQRFKASLAGFRPFATILDLEEGNGDQSGRQHAWLAEMASDPADDWTYSGLYFARDHGVTVDWIAAYGNREPTVAHRLWQYTDAASFPGIAGHVDASTFNGTIDDLIAMTHGVTPPVPQEDDMQIVIVTPADYPDGRAHPHKGQWWAAYGLWRTYVPTPDLANELVFLGAKANSDGGPITVPADYFDFLVETTPQIVVNAPQVNAPTSAILKAVSDGVLAASKQVG